MLAYARFVAARAIVPPAAASTTFGHRPYMVAVMATNQRGPRVATAIRLPEDLHKQLQEQAEMRDVSVNWLVNRAVEKFVDELPSREKVEATLRAR